MGFSWQDALSGGTGGAMAGSSFGPIGTIGGGIIGGLLGGFGGGNAPNRNDYLLPGYQQRADQLNQFTNQWGTINQPSQGYQTNALNLLQQGAVGKGPSAAQSLLQSARDENIGNQMSLAASGRGNAALNSRNAMQNIATLNQQAANQAATIRAQEQQAALAGLSGLSTSARGQDIDSTLGARQSQLNAVNLGLANAQGQQSGTIGYQNALMSKQSQPTMGDQLLSGGANMIASRTGQNNSQGIAPNRLLAQREFDTFRDRNNQEMSYYL